MGSFWSSNRGWDGLRLKFCPSFYCQRRPQRPKQYEPGHPRLRLPDKSMLRCDRLLPQILQLFLSLWYLLKVPGTSWGWRLFFRKYYRIPPQDRSTIGAHIVSTQWSCFERIVFATLEIRASWYKTHQVSMCTRACLSWNVRLLHVPHRGFWFPCMFPPSLMRARQALLSAPRWFLSARRCHAELCWSFGLA